MLSYWSMNKEELAIEALTSNKCWICPTVQRGKLEYIAAYNANAYGKISVIDCSIHEDQWECLRLGLMFLNAS